MLWKFMATSEDNQVLIGHCASYFSIDNLRCLTGIEKLEELRLQDKIHGLSNPMCLNRTYRSDLLDMFPNLKILDGKHHICKY